MNTKIIAAIIAVILIGGGAFLFTQNKNNSNTEVQSETEKTDSVESTGAETASILSLMESRDSRQCTFVTTAEGSESTGTIYVHDGKMRGDFNIKTADITVPSHTIFDGSMSYIWTDGTGYGIKMKVDPAAQAESFNNQAVDLKKNFEMDCKGWDVDNSKFEAPTNVKFNEMTIPSTADLSAGAETSIDVNPNVQEVQLKMQAEICNAIPEPQKSECLASMQR